MVAVPLGPAPVDISGIRAGDLNEFKLTLLSGGAPVNLTGSVVTASAKIKTTDSTGINAVITVTDAPNGVIMIRWPGDDVRTFLADKPKVAGVWDLQVGNGDGDPTTLLAGSFSAEMDVTV